MIVHALLLRARYMHYLCAVAIILRFIVSAAHYIAHTNALVHGVYIILNRHRPACPRAVFNFNAFAIPIEASLLLFFVSFSFVSPFFSLSLSFSFLSFPWFVEFAVNMVAMTVLSGVVLGTMTIGFGTLSFRFTLGKH